MCSLNNKCSTFLVPTLHVLFNYQNYTELQQQLLITNRHLTDEANGTSS